MGARSLFPMLSCTDLDASLRFYGDGGLGGVEAYRFPPEGEPAFVTLKLGESELGLGPLGDGAGALHGRPMRPASGHRVELCVYVDDVDASVSALRARGAPVVLEPRDMPWGERVAYAEDPDGNLVMLAARAAG
ncbi:MAG TPA: VOC family protein [Capillimicrobium sp.]|jgi:lactoylglutathione lyase